MPGVKDLAVEGESIYGGGGQKEVGGVIKGQQEGSLW